VAIEALKWEKTMAEISSEYAVLKLRFQKIEVSFNGNAAMPCALQEKARLEKLKLAAKGAFFGTSPDCLIRSTALKSALPFKTEG